MQEQDKTAAGSGKTIAAEVAILVASSLMGRLLYEAASAGANQVDRTANMRRHWDKLKAIFPEELAGDDSDVSKRNFEAIYRVAPTLAKIPQITIHYLRQAKDYSTGGFDPSTIETLAKTEAAVSGNRQKRLAPIREISLDPRSLGDMMSPRASNIATLPIGIQDLLV